MQERGRSGREPGAVLVDFDKVVAREKGEDEQREDLPDDAGHHEIGA